MKSIGYFLLFLFLGILAGCDGQEQRVPRQKTPVLYNENPIIAYCGVHCDRCHNSYAECIRLVQENLPALCDNTKQNCYDLWVQYAARCRQFCRGQ